MMQTEGKPNKNAQNRLVHFEDCAHAIDQLFQSALNKQGPDTIPIIILWPFGPVQFLFELADTYGWPLPAQDQNPLSAQGTVTEDLYQHTTTAAENFAVEVIETDQYGGNLAGTAAGLGVCPEKVAGNKERSFRVKLKAMELEAEAVAWLVCQRNGITPRSREYLNRLIDGAGLESVSMYTIYEAANRVESRTVPKKK